MTDHTPSLFDEPEEPVDEALEDWEEVPQARFLSWSHAMQLHYCYRRDLDAALRATSHDEASFFLDRAAGYKADLDHAREHDT